jgi:hypothetical protein
VEDQIEALGDEFVSVDRTTRLLQRNASPAKLGFELQKKKKLEKNEMSSSIFRNCDASTKLRFSVN